jgi:hypothetical protein
MLEKLNKKPSYQVNTAPRKHHGNQNIVREDKQAAEEKRDSVPSGT